METRNIRQKIKNFYKRWNIKISEEECFEEFKNRVLIIIDLVLAKEFLSNEELENNFLKLIGKHYPKTIIGTLNEVLKSPIIIGKKFQDSYIYNIFIEEKDYIKFIRYIQSIFWLDLNDSLREEFYNELKKILEISLVNIEIKKIKNKDIILYPRGAKFLDENLINDNLDWLIDYPNVYKLFKNVLEKYQNKIYERNLLDDLRLSLELLLKNIFKNESNLENQGNRILKELENKGYSKHIRNMIYQVFKYYCQYQNDYVKHNDIVNLSEIEYMIYLTGLLIRFFITIK